jgi:hypothetical protein
MSPITTTWRAAAGVGAAALIGLVLAGPALASPSAPNPGPPSYNSWPSLSQAQPNPGPPSYNSWPNYTPNSRDTGSTGSTVTLASDSLQYVQIGLGALGGAALTGVSAVAMASRQRRQRPVHA